MAVQLRVVVCGASQKRCWGGVDKLIDWLIDWLIDVICIQCVIFGDLAGHVSSCLHPEVFFFLFLVAQKTCADVIMWNRSDFPRRDSRKDEHGLDTMDLVARPDQPRDPKIGHGHGLGLDLGLELCSLVLYLWLDVQSRRGKLETCWLTACKNLLSFCLPF